MAEQDVGIDHHQLATGLVRATYSSRGGVEFRATRNHLPLNKYLSAGQITIEQHRAGNRIYNLYMTSSHIHTPVQMRYSDLGSSLKEYERKFQINQEYMAAIMAVHHKQRRLIQDVCLDGLKAGRGKMDDLRLGLDALIRFFKEPHNI